MTVNELATRLQELVKQNPDIGSNVAIVRVRRQVVDRRMRGGVRSESEHAVIDCACDGSLGFSDGSDQRFTELYATPFVPDGRMKNAKGRV